MSISLLSSALRTTSVVPVPLLSVDLEAGVLELGQDDGAQELALGVDLRADDDGALLGGRASSCSASMRWSSRRERSRQRQLRTPLPRPSSCLRMIPPHGRATARCSCQPPHDLVGSFPTHFGAYHSSSRASHYACSYGCHRLWRRPRATRDPALLWHVVRAGHILERLCPRPCLPRSPPVTSFNLTDPALAPIAEKVARRDAPLARGRHRALREQRPARHRADGRLRAPAHQRRPRLLHGQPPHQPDQHLPQPLQVLRVRARRRRSRAPTR